MRNARKGFTLIELMLSIAAFGSVMLILTMLLGTVISARLKNQSISDVEEEGSAAMGRILLTARNAQAVVTPVPGAPASSLALIVDNPFGSPTVFDAAAGTIRISEGIGATVALTSPRVIVTAISFSNLARPGTPGSIQVEFTLMHRNPEARQEYDVTKTFYGTATLH